MPETPQITIRWRRYGRTGGKWRADMPPGNGIDSGSIESPSLDTVERFAAVVAEHYGYQIVREPAPVDALLGADPDYLGGQPVDDYIREARRD